MSPQQKSRLQLAPLPDNTLGIFAVNTAAGWLPCRFAYSVNPSGDYRYKVKRTRIVPGSKGGWITPDVRADAKADKYRIRPSGRTVTIDTHAIDRAIRCHSLEQAHGRHDIESLPPAVDAFNQINGRRGKDESLADFYVRMLSEGVGEPVQVWAAICRFYPGGEDLLACNPSSAYGCKASISE